MSFLHPKWCAPDNSCHNVESSADTDRNWDIELIFETTVTPNLKDKDLQQAYACAVPSDIVPMIFKAGEIGAIARAILKSAGFGINELEIKIHEEIKNS